jgi:thiol-disulfide isomerase/thioredoxin
MKSKFLFITLIVSNILFSQTELRVGDIAPDITITDYISNIPKDKSFKNKFILLEFWATWCGTCLQEVPNLNKFQENFKSKKDFVFVSITDEKPEKVLKTLKRISFNSMVVSDQTKKTHKNFIETKEGSFSLPTTVLIDNKGIVKWIGTPFELNDVLLNKFINGKELKKSDQSLSNVPPAPVFRQSNEEQLTDIAYKTIDNKGTQYSFILLDGINESGTTNFNNLNDEGSCFYLNTYLNSILSDLIGVPEFQIILSENLKKNNYGLFYKHKDFNNEKEAKMEIKENLLRCLNLNESIVFKDSEVYILTIKDKTKLEEVKNETGVKDGMNKTHFLFSNVNINSVINKIGIEYKVIVKDETGLKGKYDFILKRNSLDETIKDLEVYGLTLNKSNEKVKFYEYHDVSENKN